MQRIPEVINVQKVILFLGNVIFFLGRWDHKPATEPVAVAEIRRKLHEG